MDIGRGYFPSDYLIEVSRGNIPNEDIIHKFGRNSAVSTSLVPITSSGIYRTPVSATALEIVSDDLNDTADGTGARSITVVGLSSTGAEQQETVATNGTTAVALSKSYLRVYRMYVETSGVYASATQSSHAGTITLRESGGGDTWAQIDVNAGGFGLGQSLIGLYTVPLGCTAYILSFDYSTDSNKAIDMYFFKRNDILTTSAPFSPMRVQNLYAGIQGTGSFNHRTNESYPALSDIGFMGIVASVAADVSVEFELLLITN